MWLAASAVALREDPAARVDDRSKRIHERPVDVSRGQALGSERNHPCSLDHPAALAFVARDLNAADLGRSGAVDEGVPFVSGLAVQALQLQARYSVTDSGSRDLLPNPPVLLLAKLEEPDAAPVPYRDERALHGQAGEGGRWQILGRQQLLQGWTRARHEHQRRAQGDYESNDTTSGSDH